MSCLSMQNNKKKEYTLEQSDTSISLLSFYAHCKPYKKNKADHWMCSETQKIFSLTFLLFSNNFNVALFF